MSDSHEEYNGGHELEALPVGTLFKVIFGLGAIVLAACFVVVQFFHQQRAYLEFHDNGAQAGYHLSKYWDDMDADKGGLAETAASVKTAADLKAPKPEPGYDWPNPDNIKEAGK